MKNLPIGIQAFSKLRENNCVYIDKTKEIYEMTQSGTVYFLSRPRRFGKSLLVSAMENLFKGEKELFKGLFIEDKWDWEKKSPVIKLDFGAIGCDSPEALRKSLADFLETQVKKYKIELKVSEDILPRAFDNLITELQNKFSSKVVLLIDEYDKPILDNISKPKIREANKEILHSFYQVIKAKDEFLRFVFITGVSKFAGLSIFSALNNLEDITFDEKYNSICGYTQEELEANFPERIAAISQKLQISEQDLLGKIKRFYNGYSWNGQETVYNPFSTLRFFKVGKFRHFWFETATPTFLINILKERNNIANFLDVQTISPRIFSSDNLDYINEISLMFQTGYLTVKNIEESDDDEDFTLGIPNIEVRKALLECLLSAYAEQSHDIVSALSKQMIKQIAACDGAGFEKNLTMLFAKNPYQLKKEANYHSLFVIAMFSLGFNAQGEVSTDKGRIDVVIYGRDWTAIVELKHGIKKPLNTLLKEAMKQIDDRKYYEGYMNKRVILIAIACSPKGLKCEMKEIES